MIGIGIIGHTDFVVAEVSALSAGIGDRNNHVEGPIEIGAAHLLWLDAFENMNDRNPDVGIGADVLPVARDLASPNARRRERAQIGALESVLLIDLSVDRKDSDSKERSGQGQAVLRPSMRRRSPHRFFRMPMQTRHANASIRFVVFITPSSDSVPRYLSRKAIRNCRDGMGKPGSVT